jgi:hypothetical protein
MFVTEELRSAVADAEKFKQESDYESLMCLKKTKGGVGFNTFTSALSRCSEYISEEDKKFYQDFFNKYSAPLCVLPKGHSGKCTCSYGKFFSERFANKIKDCDTTPGDDDILYKNRARRYFPIQVTKNQYTVLNAKYKWKGNVLLKAATPTENAGTNFTIATAHFDFAAILLLQKGIEHKLPEDIEYELLDRAESVVDEFAQEGINIVDKNGQLCDPVLGYTLQPEWYGIDDKRDPNQIQFGHVNPLRSDKYMTRGLNILPITRRGNLIQSDTPLSEVHNFIQHAYEHTRPR